MSKIAQILWLDLEMTGLDPLKDKILEVAVIATDWDFKEIAAYESGVGHDETLVTDLLDLNPFYVKMKDNRKALIKLSKDSPPSEVIEKQLVKFINEHCDTSRPVVLAGNSIHIDRQFINAEWPFVNQLLHYRMLDVTAWKLVFENKFSVEYKKQEKHRALEDVRESIAELKTYLGKVSEA